MFTSPAALARSGVRPRTAGFNPAGQQEWLARSRRSVAWAVGNNESGVAAPWKPYVEIILEIRRARVRWMELPSQLRPPPHDVALHGPLARAVDDFNTAVDEFWDDAFDDLMALAGRDAGDDGDYDENDDEGMEVEEHVTAPSEQQKQQTEPTAEERARQGALLQQLVINQDDRARAANLAEATNNLKVEDEASDRDEAMEPD